MSFLIENPVRNSVLPVVSEIDSGDLGDNLILQTEPVLPTQPGRYVVLNRDVVSIPIFPSMDQTRSGALAILSTSLPYVMLKDGGEDNGSWVEVQLPDGRSGWIDTASGVQIVEITSSEAESLQVDNFSASAQVGQEGLHLIFEELTSLRLSCVVDMHELHPEEYVIIEYSTIRIELNASVTYVYSWDGEDWKFLHQASMQSVDESAVQIKLQAEGTKLVLYADGIFVTFVEHPSSGAMSLGVKAGGKRQTPEVDFSEVTIN